MRPGTRVWRLVLALSLPCCLGLPGCEGAVERDIDTGNEARLTQRLASPEGQARLATRGDQWLVRAVQAGQVESVEALLSAGVPHAQAGAEGRALLSQALAVEDVRAAAGVLRALVRHGVRPTSLDAQGRTALHEALELRRPLLVRELLTLWPDVEDFDPRPARLLVHAAELGELQSVQELVSAGVLLEDPSLLSTPLAPALLRALRVSHLRFLVEDAARRGDRVALRELRAGTAPEVWEALGLGPAHLAVLNQDGLALAVALREEPSRREAREGRGLTPLLLAARVAGPGMAVALARAGADLEARSPGGRTPLMLAAHLGREEMVRALLEEGAAVNAEDVLGESALSLAARGGFLAPAQRLLAAGALLVREGPLGSAARAASEPLKEMLTRAHARFLLRWAVAVGPSAEEVRLRRAGATLPPVPGSLDAAPYIRAVLSGELSSLEALAASHPADLERLLRPREGRTLLHWAALGGSVASAAWLLDRGAALDAREPASPLGLALEEGHLGVAELLVERGAGWEGGAVGPVTPVQQQLLARARNNAALASALREGRLEALAGLLAAGAGGKGGVPRLAPGTLTGRILRHEDLAALTRRELSAVGPDAAGDTPLHYAAAAGDLAAVEKLLALGAAASPRDKAGVTPLGYAARVGAVDVLRRLLEARASALELARPGQSAIEAALCAPHPKAALLLLSRTTAPGPLKPECLSRALSQALAGEEESDALALLAFWTPAGPEAVLALAREAAAGDRPGVLGALLARHGALLEPRTAELLQAATRAGASESVTLLLERGGPADAGRLQEVAREALVAGRSEVAMLAVERGADPLLRQREADPARRVGATREHPEEVSLVGLALALGDEAFLEHVRTRRPEVWTRLREDAAYFPLAVSGGGPLVLVRGYVERGANLLDEDATGAPLLGTAGSVEVATWLFEQGAILEPPPPLDESTEPTVAPETPFAVAVSRGHFDVGTFFLSRGARARVAPVLAALDARRAAGPAAEALAALLRERAWTVAQRGALVEGLAERSCDMPALLEAALTGLSPAEVAERTDAALVRLVQCEDPRSLEVLVRRGANPRAVDAAGRDVLTRALRVGRAPGARTLLALGVKPLAVTGDPFATVRLALEGQQRALARAMLELGLKEGPEGRALASPERDVALVLALRARAWTLAARLLSEGASVRVARGESPLALVLEPAGGGSWMAELFLAMGGTDPSGDALKTWLARGEGAKAGRLLREGRVPVDAAFEVLVASLPARGSAGAVPELLREWTRGSWEALSRGQREQLLWLAVGRDDVALASLLLERMTVDPALRDGDGRSLLQRAAGSAGRRLMETLVARGARLEAGATACPSPLDVARGREDAEGRELARWLAARGAGGCGGAAPR